MDGARDAGGGIFVHGASRGESRRSKFRQFIRDVAFLHVGSFPSPVVVKWSRNVAISERFESATPLALVKNINETIIDTQAATGRAISLFSAHYDVAIVYSNWLTKDLDKRIDIIAPFFGSHNDAAAQYLETQENSKRSCAYKILVDPRGNIQAGLILVNVGFPDATMIEHCQTRALASLFGLGVLKAADLPYPSVVNDTLKATSLTSYDKKLLRILYNPAIHAGVAEDLALGAFDMLANQ